MFFQLGRRGSSRRYTNADEVRPGVPRTVLESWDWAVRTDPDLVRPGAGRPGAFGDVLQQRLNHLRPLRTPVPDVRAGLAFMRYRREEQYVFSIAEPAREGPYSREVGVHVDILFDPEVPVLSQRTQAAHWGQHADLDPQWSMPKSMRQYETRQRHRLELYIPAFCLEANWMSPGHRHRVYVPFAAWWPAYELPYGLRAELPKCLAYFSRRLLGDPEDVMWSVFRTEWVAECLKEALLAARGGRLWWLPTRVRVDLDELGVDNVL